MTAPTQLIVSANDEALLQINQRSMDRLLVQKRLSVVAGAGHLFDEPGAIEEAAELAAEWLAAHLKPIKRT